MTASLIGIEGAVAPDLVQERDAHVTVRPADITVEWLEPAEERGGARISHAPTGITAEARAYPTRSENYRAALQTLALQLVERGR